MEKENEFSGAVAESESQRMMRVFFENQIRADEDRRLANEDRRLANERVLLSDARIEKALAELAGQKALIDEVELGVHQLQANNLNEERFAEIDGVQEVLKQEMS